ncbi:hypothetical protein GOD68_18220 [Sinorhizobium medicae]|nr:hypothetical protein [Sinorhizobium medicae]
MKKNSSYMTRALRSNDRRFALVLGKLGHTAPLLRSIGKSKATTSSSTKPAASDDLTALRVEYQDVVGKRPFHGWDAGTLKTKIAEAKG